MDDKRVKSTMKPSSAVCAPRLGHLIVAVFMICSAFLICNYLLVNQRITAMEELLEGLQRNDENQNSHNASLSSLDDQSGAHHMLSAKIRERRAVKQQTQITIADLEKRIKDLEKRINANNRYVIPPKESSDWWLLAYLRGRDGRDGREGLMGPPGPPGKSGIPGTPGKQGIAGRKGEAGKPGTNKPFPGPPGPKGDKGAVGRTGDKGPQGSKGEKGQDGAGKSGVKYVRWGKTTCPNGAHMVYKGLVGSGHYYHYGGGGQYLCLPNNPKYDKYKDGFQHGSYIYGTEYEVSSAFNPFKKNLHNHDVPCTVCYVRSRASQLMMPARNDCPSGWTEEYHGYLMSWHHGHRKSGDFVCIDADAEFVHGSHANKDGALLYPVEGQCGSLPCLPYVNGRELTCAVCTK